MGGSTGRRHGATVIGGVPPAFARMVELRLGEQGRRVWRIPRRRMPAGSEDIAPCVAEIGVRCGPHGGLLIGCDARGRKAIGGSLKTCFFLARAAGLELSVAGGRVVLLFEIPPAEHDLDRELICGCAGAAVEVLAANLRPRVAVNCILTEGLGFSEDSASAGPLNAGDRRVTRATEVAELASALMTESNCGTGRVHCV